MGVYYSLAYGVALTDQFGRQLDHIPDRLMEFAADDSDQPKNGRPVQSMSTCGSDFLVLGVEVAEGGKSGLTWVPGEAALGAIHARYLKALAACPPDVRALVEEYGFVPRLCVLAGDF